MNTFVTISSQTGVTSEKLTLHQAAAAAATADKTYTTQLLKVTVQATTAGTVKIQRSGTAPTTTTATPAPIQGGGAVARVTAFTADITIARNLVANVPLEINLEHIYLLGLGATNNVTVVVTIASGNVVIELVHQENA